MFKIKSLALSFLVIGLVALPLSAGPIHWTFDNASSSSTGTAGIGFHDSTVLTGSFDYDAGVGALGTYSNVHITTTGGSIIPSTSTWFINSPADDCCSDNSFVYFVNADPASNPDLTAVGGGGPHSNPAFAINLALSGPMPTTIAVGTTIFSINLFDGTNPQEGYCVTAECGAIDTSVGPPASPTTYTTDANAHIWATRAPDVVTGDAPEPATFLLAGTMLLAIGIFRKKLAVRS